MSSKSGLKMKYFIYYTESKTTEIVDLSKFKSDKSGCKAKWGKKWFKVKVVAQSGTSYFLISFAEKKMIQNLLLILLRIVK